MEYLTKFRTIASKVETVPGTAETLADADNNIRVYDLNIGALNVEFDSDPAKYATGDFTLGESIPSNQSASITFRNKWVNKAGGLEPNWTKFTKACGCDVAAASGAWGTGWALYPDAASAEDTLTIGIYDKQRGSNPSGLFYEFAGCIGNCTIATEGTGKPYNMSYEFQGALNDITDVAVADIPELSGAQTDIADRFLNGSFTVGGVTGCISTMEFNFGNTISPVQCIGAESGIEKFGITAVEPMLTINPLLKTQADYDSWSKFTAGTIEEVIITTSQFKLTIPRAQIVSMSIEDQDGILRQNLGFRPLRSSTAGSYTYASWYAYIIN